MNVQRSISAFFNCLDWETIADFALPHPAAQSWGNDLDEVTEQSIEPHVASRSPSAIQASC